MERASGTNLCGIVAWFFTLFTPEYHPKGRKIIVIANDITYQIGSFGPAEDQFFYKSTELARQLGIPRVCIWRQIREQELDWLRSHESF